MTRVQIDTDEWWPVYSVEEDDDYGGTFELDPETIARCKFAEAEFLKVQAILRTVVEGA